MLQLSDEGEINNITLLANLETYSESKNVYSSKYLKLSKDVLFFAYGFNGNEIKTFCGIKRKFVVSTQHDCHSYTSHLLCLFILGTLDYSKLISPSHSLTTP